MRLILGDCLEVMKTLPTGSVDAVITDPPYNSNLKYSTYQDNLPYEDYWQFITEVVVECNRIAQFVIIKHSSLKIYDWTKHIDKSRMVVWYKPFSSGFPMNGFATHFEPMWVTQGKVAKWSRDVIIQNSGACNHEKSFGHPAQMPEGLANQLIDICTLPGQIVLDPFMGSGTTGVACIQTGRDFIGIEIDPGYFAIAEKRIKDAQAQGTLEMRMRV